jgi:hypothetical protein
MDHTTTRGSVFFLENFESVFESITNVDHYGLFYLFCEPDMLPEEFALQIPGRVIVVIIESRFPYGNDRIPPGKGANVFGKAVRDGFGFMRMNPHSRR